MNNLAVTKYADKLTVREVEDTNKGSEFFFSDDEIKRLIRAAPSNRDKVLIELLAYCGLRRDEARQLKIEDVDWENSWLNLTLTKRGKRRSVPVSKEVLNDLKWLAGQRKKGLFFESRETGTLNKSQINRIVAKAGETAGLKNPNPKLKNINPHLLRHSFSRRFLRNGGRMEVLQKLLGHSSITTTIDVYGRPSMADIQKEYERCICGD